MKLSFRHICSSLFSHYWSGHREVRKAFPPGSLKRIERAIANSETSHSGELRVVIEGGLGRHACSALLARPELVSLSRARAVTLFSQLGVWDTAGNSGVLIYILMAEHQLEIVADRGIHARVGEGVWQAIVSDATARFKKGDYEQELAACTIEAIRRTTAPPLSPGRGQSQRVARRTTGTVGSAQQSRDCFQLRGDRPHGSTERDVVCINRFPAICRSSSGCCSVA